MSVVEALAREVGSVGRALRHLTDAQWSSPTRCPPLSVRELVGHMVRGAARIQSMLAEKPIDDEPEKDAATYFTSFTATDDSTGVVERAQADSAARTTAELPRHWDEEWSKALRGARASLGEDLVLPSIFGTIRLSEYLKTRIVEVVIHHMDVDAALEKDPHPDAEALELAGDVLRVLLGTDLRPTGMQDVRFLLTGTGRAQLDDTERAYLGPLADKFPLFT